MAEVEKNKGGIGGLLLSLAVLSLAGLGAGYGIAGMNAAPAETAKAKPDSAAKPSTENHAQASEGKEEKHADGAATSEHAEAAEEEELAPADLTIVPCPAVITNLREPAKVWIRLEANLVIRKETEKPHETLAAEAAQQILAYLRTLKIEDIQGATGLYDISADLNEVVKGASQGDVREVLIAGLVVE